MTFTVNTLTRCSGQAHYEAALTFGGGKQATLSFNKDAFVQEEPEDLDMARDMILARLRSAWKESGATSFAQGKAVLEGQTYKV